MNRFSDRYGRLNEAAVSDYVWGNSGDAKIQKTTDAIRRASPNLRQVPPRQQAHRDRHAEPGMNVRPADENPSIYAQMMKKTKKYQTHDAYAAAYQDFMTPQVFKVHPSIVGMCGHYANLYSELYGNQQVELNIDEKTKESAFENAQVIHRMKAKKGMPIQSVVREWAITNRDLVDSNIFIATLMELNQTPGSSKPKQKEKSYNFNAGQVNTPFGN